MPCIHLPHAIDLWLFGVYLLEAIQTQTPQRAQGYPHDIKTPIFIRYCSPFGDQEHH